MDCRHVYPLNDLIEHDTGELNGNYSCPCNPKIEIDIGLIIHNSMDRRENNE